MLFSRDWLAEHAPLPATVAQLAERLTLGGFAVEALEERDGDLVLDVDVTTNRPDAMCHRGLAREVAALTGRQLRAQEPPPAATADAEEAASRIAVEIEDPADCPRYVARIVRGVKVRPSPPWLARRLTAIGLRPINAIVDVTNYVLWETGQPLHAFDLDRVSGGRIIVRRARQAERLRTLDGEERALHPEILVIADAERALALAGVIGGTESEVTDETVDVLIEAAHFTPVRVRRGARRLGLRTDASHRFERGVDPELCRHAADRAAALIAELGGGRALSAAVDCYPGEIEWSLSGTLEADRLDRFAGQPIPPAEVEGSLAGLGFELERQGERAWRVTAPSWRYYDLRPRSAGAEIYEADLFEEVLRVRGYDSIEPRLPALAGPDAGSAAAWRRRDRVRDHLAACGLAEAINYGFYSLEADRRFPVLDAEAGPVEVLNPLSERYAVMRRSLLPGLVESALFNLRRGAAAVRLFEIGHLFAGAGDRAREEEAVGLLVAGVPGEPWDRTAELDTFHLKGIVESLARSLGVELAFRPAQLPAFVPGTAAEIYAAAPGGGLPRPAGHLGQLDEPEVRIALFAAQLATSALGQGAGGRALRLPSRFPGIQMDLTVTHPEGVSFAAIAAAVGERREDLLVDFGLKDRYQGPPLPAGAVSTTLHFHFNATDRSLTQEEVNAARDRLRADLEGRFGHRAEPPGGAAGGEP